MAVNAWALRPFRVGSTQSNMSTPCRTDSKMSRGIPTPIRYRGRSAGNKGTSWSNTPIICSWGFSDGKPSDGVTGKLKFEKLLGALSSKIVLDAALDDSKQRLILAVMMTATLMRPVHRSPDRFGHNLFVARVGGALIQNHDDVRPDQVLGFNDRLRRHDDSAAVEMRAKNHRFVVHLRQIGQRKHLISTAVGQNRAVPRHESVKSAPLRNQFRPRSLQKMIGISQQNGGSGVVNHLRGQPSYSSTRSDRHKHGCFNRTVRCQECARSGGTARIAVCDLESEHSTIIPVRLFTRQRTFG